MRWPEANHCMKVDTIRTHFQFHKMMIYSYCLHAEEKYFTVNISNGIEFVKNHSKLSAHSMSPLDMALESVSSFCSIFTMRTTECWQFSALPSLMMAHVSLFFVRFATITYISSLIVEHNASKRSLFTSGIIVIIITCILVVITMAGVFYECHFIWTICNCGKNEYPLVLWNSLSKNFNIHVL